MIKLIAIDMDVTAFQEAVEEALISKFSGVRSQDYIYEIMPQGVTKARGLKSLIAKLGLDINQVMAIGDAPNDIELLDLVPNSVAMGNASDEIKSRCKYITVDNNQAGVAKAIYDYALR
ncbi:Haloacid dehalogenase [Streptococcus agalactiae]|nr:Haloacid dehalogenase [Streptococcus agalactiae]EJZ02689.1 Cof-like hydrolase [Streptococcus agalactiae STIR-CD-17]EPU06247.1 haloacid dehalogenase [Streptococcus agalactiae STIR-CD-09]EPU06780.1 haloacid dehalogenase [Streptococcus agalactiae STIR-CD-13]EPW88632.1 haloacid dehalogenase [Streptococcus agalactiae STIR-CD-07]